MKQAQDLHNNEQGDPVKRTLVDIKKEAEEVLNRAMDRGDGPPPPPEQLKDKIEILRLVELAYAFDSFVAQAHVDGWEDYMRQRGFI